MVTQKMISIPPEEAEIERVAIEAEIERVQTGIRMDKRLIKVLRATADYKDLSLGSLLENIVVYAFGTLPSPFTSADLERIRQLWNVYYDEGEHRGSDESRVFNHIINVAVRHGTQKIQLEPQPDGFIHVFFDLDGEMKDYLRVPTEPALEPLMKYIKDITGMGADENSNPHESSLHIQMSDDSKFKLQISIQNTQLGDEVTLRLQPL